MSVSSGMSISILRCAGKLTVLPFWQLKV